MQKITPFLWFDNQAEEAARFYTSIFKNSELHFESQPEGQVMVAPFSIEGQKFLALNGGPLYKFTEAVSFMINCQSQEEVDYYWDRLTEGGEPGQCGWLKDKYGLSWQVTPSVLGELLGDPDREKSGRVMQAMLQMSKLDIPTLQRAYEGQ